MVDVSRSALLAAVPHGFLGRQGGLSGGFVASLNVGLGAGDDDAAVAENRRRAVDAVLPGARLVTVFQVHSADAVIVREPWTDAQRPVADALVTDRPGLLLGIVTADCAPVLLADTQAGVVGAAHAGWKGAHGGVVESTLAAMERLGADRSRMAAAIGPCIAQASYEVDDGFRARFTDDRDGAFFAPGRPGHWQFDLEGHVAAQLARGGVAAVDRMGLDTYRLESRFFSFRRASHRDEPNYGRQMSLIGMAPA